MKGIKRGKREKKDKPALPGLRVESEVKRAENPLLVLFRTSEYSLNGTVLQTPGGVFYGYRSSPGIPIGSKVFPYVKDGVISIQFSPATQKTDEIITKLRGEMNALIQKKAPPSQIQQYSRVIEDISKNPDKTCLVSVFSIYSPHQHVSEISGDGNIPVPPLFASLFESPQWTGVVSIDALHEYLLLPHIQEYEFFLPFAISDLGEVIHFPCGKKTNASHTLIVGATGSGKSCSAKLLSYLIKNSPQKEIQAILTDLKGEYVEGNEGLFGYPPLKVNSMKYCISFLSFEAAKSGDLEEFKRTVSLEAAATRRFLRYLGYSIGEDIVAALIFDAVKKRKTPYDVFEAIASKLNLPRTGFIKQWLGSEPNFQIKGNIIFDLSSLPYQSELQVGAFLFFIPLIVKKVMNTGLTCFIVEEAHLIDPDYLNTLLRLMRAKGIALVIITQSVKDLEKLGGGKEQFRNVFYFGASIENAKETMSILFGRQWEAPKGLRKLVNDMPTTKPGRGLWINVDGQVIPYTVHIPKKLLEEIHRFANPG